MKDLTERPIKVAEYMLENKSTVRSAAKHFGISKSTIHKDIAYRLRFVNGELFKEAAKLLELNKNERHIRGGNATKKKYEKLEKKLTR